MTKVIVLSFTSEQYLLFDFEGKIAPWQPGISNHSRESRLNISNRFIKNF